MNHPINHVGLSVPDIEAAEKWYVDVLGFARLCPSVTEDRDVDADTAALNILPPTVRKVKIAFLGTGNSIGLELFQFIDPEVEPGREADSEKAERDVRLGGLFHFAVTTPDIEGMCQKVIENGGKKVHGIGSSHGEDGVYVQDPWGNVVELITSTFERLFSNR